MLSLPSPAKTEWLSMLPQGDQTESNTYNNKNCIVSVENPVYNTHIFGCNVEKKTQNGVHQRFLTGGTRTKNGLRTARGKKNNAKCEYNATLLKKMLPISFVADVKC